MDVPSLGFNLPTARIDRILLRGRLRAISASLANEVPLPCGPRSPHGAPCPLFVSDHFGVMVGLLLGGHAAGGHAEGGGHVDAAHALAGRKHGDRSEHIDILESTAEQPSAHQPSAQGTAKEAIAKGAKQTKGKQTHPPPVPITPTAATARRLFSIESAAESAADSAAGSAAEPEGAPPKVDDSEQSMVVSLLFLPSRACHALFAAAYGLLGIWATVLGMHDPHEDP